jgi:hypothetical protein
MIRRATWLVLGAAAGIAGYRKLARAAKTLLPQGELLGPVSRRSTRDARPRRASGRGADAGTAAFVRDVRAGMADYLDRHRDI